MLIASLVFSIFFATGACAAYRFGARSNWRFTRFFIYGLLAVVFSLAVNLPVLATAVVLIVAGIVCRGMKASPGRFAWAATVGTLFVYVGICLSRVPTFLERQRIRERNPIESLSSRLDYEQRSTARRPAMTEPANESVIGESRAATAAPTNYARRLNALEEVLAQGDWRWRSRSQALQIIHSSYVEQFIDSPGFGLVRGMWLVEPERFADATEPKVFRLPPGEFFDPEGSPSDASAIDSVPPSAAPLVVTPLAARQLESLHEVGVFDFINRRGWGYVEDRDHVAGFQPHQFRTPPVVPARESVSTSPEDVFERRSMLETFDRETDSHNTDQNWQVRKLQLVSLLKYDEPSVYVTNELPRMDRLVDVPVRLLDVFEQSALRSLESGEDVVSDSTDANRIRMLGAIRAAKQCLKCHSVERGELLGAFSYELQRTQPVREQREAAPPAF